ncbi:MAG TPA: ACP S-malonyltransferase [Acidimicrobiales bacterium]|nr:ACP S-malonyltransferase [Acidimicrobiales bacterium]
MAVAVIFPGQGAQAPGLGTPWIDTPSWSLVERAEEATGESLAPLLTDAPAEALTRTREAQLVVFLASLLAWDVAGPALEEAHVEVVAFGGHSLGQVTALVAAGALSFDDGCRLAARRARHTQDAADARPGRLAALLGATIEQAQDSCAAAAGSCWIANDNAPGQVVIGGTPDGLEAASTKAKELGVKRVMALNVGGAFHTPLMQAAADAFAADLAAAPFADTAVPVMSNHDAQPYTDARGWPDRLTEQLIRPVRWAATMPALVGLGADTFVEVGPGSTLTGLAKRAHPEITLRNVASPADLPLETAHA